jgi:16S rRNA (uracil1498-N3)-methyltransferase
MARDIRIFTRNDLAVDNTVLLEKTPSHHCAQVLRLTAGKIITLFNGNGFECRAKITQIVRGVVEINVLSVQQPPVESSLKIHLAQGLSRGQKMDFVIQKSVECGVSQITPLLTEHSGVKIAPDKVKKKLAHWQQVAISACEQSGRCLVPQVFEPVSFYDYLSRHKEVMLMAHFSSDSEPPLPDDLNNVHLLIGPEGGFSEQEYEYAKKNQCGFISLGPRVLRTETAPIVAMSLLQSRYGDINL